MSDWTIVVLASWLPLSVLLGVVVGPFLAMSHTPEPVVIPTKTPEE